MKFGTCGFFTNLLRKVKFDKDVTRIMDTLHAELCTFMIIYH